MKKEHKTETNLLAAAAAAHLRAGERLPKQRPLAPHLHTQKFLQVVEAGSIVLQSRNESSGSRGKDKSKQGTTQNAATKNDESVDRDAEIVRLIEERRKLPKEEKYLLKELSKKIKKCIREKKRVKDNMTLKEYLKSSRYSKHPESQISKEESLHHENQKRERRMHYFTQRNR